MKKVSVLIPVYNSEKSISSILHCLSKQEFTDFEIIIVDDASIDQTVTTIKSFASSYPNLDIQLLQNKRNEGVSFSRNRCLELASAELVLFVDADDFVAENHLSQLISPFSNPSIDIVACNYTLHYCKDNKYSKNTFTFQGKIESKKALQNLLEDQERAYLWKYMFRRSLFTNIQFPEGCNFSEDSIVLPMLFANAKCIQYPNKETAATYIYEIHDNSLTTSKVNAKNFIKLAGKIHDTVSYITYSRTDIDVKFLSIFQFRFTYNLVTHVLNSDNIIYKDAKRIYNHFSTYLIKDQLFNLIKFKKMRSLNWLFRLRFFPHSIWQH